MAFITMILSLFGLGWLLLIIMVSIFGGRILIELKNPSTKKVDRITDFSINRTKNKV